MRANPSLGSEGIMFTLVQIPSSPKSSQQTASLVADYLTFDRQRTSRRQYAKAFGGMAIVVLLGALFGRVDLREAEIVGALLLLPPAVLVAVEWIHWRGLVKRLDRVRAEAQTIRKS
jgi:hypothetical protein